ncbi:MAG: MotA/TolQ/ExbB proton channel family protein [Candidatus Hydrogenedentes bacterium]|nr:MotA/TolQ/ExbB proton channel family protein [Candidatus Hydrogenedentota bacterium]
MDVFWFAISHDWAVLLPIILCSVLCVAVTIERLWYFRINKVMSVDFVHHLQRDLENSLDAAKATADRHRGIIGEVAREGLSILRAHPERFESMFDVTTSLATRELERGLTVLGTIAAISPYLGLFGTVVRILLTFGELASTQSGGDVSLVMAGIGSALIATAFGLGVAIVAVALNNYFRTHVQRFDGDFEVLKLVFMSAIGMPAQRPQRPVMQPQRRPGYAE